ncbi:MAG: sarcosine oxidase subunit gamma [Natronospirillum sp.]|uniref:sarcosine oxidase subunit gamma family protein n=1 Tax=Natronospirillum sp. TaxID=2812955 RepID=UPI0025E43E58|nr:sarcosine oxidase subunit gamma family protein [Natronospirillum sp.]MCH8552169.1 sarcosine oxidase subunit gamma [Natronospirillum sp.]
MSDPTSMLPDQHPRRSLAWRVWAASTQSLAVKSEGLVVQQAGENDSAMAERCGLIDLTVLERTGFRGRQAAEHLESLDLPVPDAPNRAAVGTQGETVLRLSARELWVLSAAEDDGQHVRRMANQPLPTKDCYALYCQHSHAWLVLAGRYRAAVMAKLCGVDLRESAFPVGHIAQTSVARSNAIVVHHQWGRQPVFSLFCDSASADYLWEALLDAMAEFEGGPVGLAALV